MLLYHHSSDIVSTTTGIVTFMTIMVTVKQAYIKNSSYRHWACGYAKIYSHFQKRSLRPWLILTYGHSNLHLIAHTTLNGPKNSVLVFYTILVLGFMHAVVKSFRIATHVVIDFYPSLFTIISFTGMTYSLCCQFSRGDIHATWYIKLLSLSAVSILVYKATFMEQDHIRTRIY